MDLNEMVGIDENDNNSPTIEDVKRIVDSKRIKRSPSKTYTREDRIKNLELAREKKNILNQL